MKHLATALTALAILGCGAALADDQPAPRAPVATPLKKMSLKACNKQADDRRLEGKARMAFIKECRTRNAPVPPLPPRWP
jgi:hypothetical protein